MSNLQCPACKQNIDGDSLFCDQCGEQIFVCSVCGRAGKGKRCIYDGKEMVAAGGNQSSATDHITPPPVQPQSTPSPAPSPSQPAGNKIKISAQNLGIVIEAQEGDVLGRTKGTFSAVLGRFPQISGSHCQISKTNGMWSITDLGSTNGTYLNGAKIAPNAPAVINDGARVKLADIEFIVSFSAPASGTQRI